MPAFFDWPAGWNVPFQVPFPEGQLQPDVPMCGLTSSTFRAGAPLRASAPAGYFGASGLPLAPT